MVTASHFVSLIMMDARLNGSPLQTVSSYANKGLLPSTCPKAYCKCCNSGDSDLLPQSPDCFEGEEVTQGGEDLGPTSST